MADIKDVRRWLEGEDVPGLPKRDEVWPHAVRVVKVRKTANPNKLLVVKYRVADDGDDALLLSGQYSGKTLRQVARIDVEYLRALARCAVEELSQLVSYIMVQMRLGDDDGGKIEFKVMTGNGPESCCLYWGSYDMAIDTGV
jgi:hypothetical protein